MAASPDASHRRRLVVDLARAFEGILLGLVVVILAAILAGGGFGTYDFAAVIVIPAVLMLAFMRHGAPPRRLFAVRALGALAGWAVTWLVLIPLFLLAYYAAFPAAPTTLVFSLLAVLAGILVGLLMAAADRIARRLRRPSPATD